jgi:hypothetical protein
MTTFDRRQIVALGLIVLLAACGSPRWHGPLAAAADSLEVRAGDCSPVPSSIRGLGPRISVICQSGDSTSSWVVGADSTDTVRFITRTWSQSPSAKLAPWDSLVSSLLAGTVASVPICPALGELRWYMQSPSVGHHIVVIDTLRKVARQHRTVDSLAPCEGDGDLSIFGSRSDK